MAHDKKYLGIYEGEKVYLTKHEWGCNWYWEFGYVGNKNCHFHFDTFLTLPDKVNGYGYQYEVDKIFDETSITQAQWWVLRDLFSQAYALKKAAEVYRYGGHQTTKAGVTDIIKNPAMAAAINGDLKIVLDKIWEIL